MRLLMSLAITLIAILGLGFWTNYSLLASTDELTRNIDQLSAEIESEQWEAAQIQIEKLERNWQEKVRWWPIFLDHQEMDNINFSLARVKAYVASRDTPLSRGQLSELRLMIKHIPEKEAVSIKNIL